MASRVLKNLSTTASAIYFLLIILQVPLFRVSCRSGMCTTPLELTSSQLIASEIFPAVVMKALLYPGALAKSLIRTTTIPSWDTILNIYNFTQSKEATEVPEPQHLEVLAGSYVSVAGAFVGLLKPGRMSMFGTILLIWGLLKEGIFGKPVYTDPPGNNSRRLIVKRVNGCLHHFLMVTCMYGSDFSRKHLELFSSDKMNCNLQSWHARNQILFRVREFAQNHLDYQEARKQQHLVNSVYRIMQSCRQVACLASNQK